MVGDGDGDGDGRVHTWPTDASHLCKTVPTCQALYLRGSRRPSSPHSRHGGHEDQHSCLASKGKGKGVVGMVEVMVMVMARRDSKDKRWDNRIDDGDGDGDGDHIDGSNQPPK